MRPAEAHADSEESRQLTSILAWIGLALTSLVVSLGTFWAFDRGGLDFSVFYQAWKLVTQGQGAEIYRDSPDRFLYAPGFAWVLAPLAYLPRELALAIWCFGKAAIIGWLVREFGRRLFPSLKTLEAAGLAAWGVLLLARPLLIDFQYGQVNLWILGTSVWALLVHFSSSGTAGQIASWTVLAIAAVGKVFPLPLLAVPFLVTSGVSATKLQKERLGIALGLLLIFFLPWLSLSHPQALALYAEWKTALVSRGLPLESHNQSFSAFLHHFFSGVPFHVVAHGPQATMTLGWAWLSLQEISWLTWAWLLATSGLFLAWIFSAHRRSPLSWIAVAVAFLIIPSHLVWKPYFVFGIPVAIIAVGRLRHRAWLLGLLLALVNFSGFDFLGREWGARAEAASLLLWVHLALMIIAARAPLSAR